VLISPWLDLTLTGASLDDPAIDDPCLPLTMLQNARRLYKPDGGYHDPSASPLFGDLTGLPPTLIQVGSRDILRDDARRIAGRFAAAGVSHRLEEWAGMHHFWHYAPIKVPETEQAFASIARYIVDGR
jgi:acetyl esterase/lipase